MGRTVKLVSITVVGAFLVLGCSWDYPVWPKNKKSDTPLFRFVVNENFGAGYIDRQGKVVIQPQFQVYGNQGGDFFEGLAKVETKEGGDFYIDASGNRVAVPVPKSTGNFFEGLATRWFPDEKKSGYVGRSGKLVIPARFDLAGAFSEGLALVKLGSRIGYVDRSGDLLIPAKFASGTSFTDGHALVIENGPCQVVGYNTCQEGPYLVQGEGGAVSKSGVSLDRCRYSVIDRTGKIVFAGVYIDAKQFAEGLAPMGDGKKWGFVDYSGQLRIRLQFDHADPFSEGLARVRRGTKVGFIDKKGEMVIPPQFSGAGDFSEGLAAVWEIRDNRIKYWFIDNKGQRAFAGEFDGASGFVMGLAHVRVGIDYYSAKWSYIDRTGRAVFTYSDQSNRDRNQ